MELTDIDVDATRNTGLGHRGTLLSPLVSTTRKYPSIASNGTRRTAVSRTACFRNCFGALLRNFLISRCHARSSKGGSSSASTFLEGVTLIQLPFVRRSAFALMPVLPVQ